MPSLYYRSLVTFVKKQPALFPANVDHYAENMTVETRGRMGLSIPAHFSTYFERSPGYRAVKAYKALPNNLQQIVCPNKFKREVTHFLKNDCMMYDFNF